MVKSFINWSALIMKTQETKVMQISLPKDLALNVAISSLKTETSKSEIIKQALEQYFADCKEVA